MKYAKRIVQTYKPAGSWRASPPGLGDYLRGACHLHEMLQGSAADFRLDLSQTEFFPLITFNPAVFQVGDPKKIRAAEEFFENDHRLQNRIDAFLQSDESELYVSTNQGLWNRRKLPESTREFVGQFFCFSKQISFSGEMIFKEEPYAVLSIRAGDQFYNNRYAVVDSKLHRTIRFVIEHEILPALRVPLVVTSDCHPLKLELVRRYGFKMLAQESQHGGEGGALPVARDLHLLRHSTVNYHINAWQPWWSGFSHYTSLLFKIRSVNFRFPEWYREEVTPSGRLLVPLKIRLRPLRDGAQQLAFRLRRRLKNRRTVTENATIETSAVRR